MSYSPENDLSTSDRRRGLMDEVQRRLRVNHYSLRTETAYLGWIRRFIEAKDRRHPKVL